MAKKAAKNQNSAGPNVFRQRLSNYLDELKYLYMEIYHDENSFNYFVEMLQRNYHERRVSLRKTDLKRSKSNGWYHHSEMMGMMMYTECFGGTLNGVREKLSYVKECGVNYLHLMPLLDSPEGKSDGGYAVSDFRKVRPDLGTMKDLEDLSAACHRRGIMLCLDFVLNHTSEEHEWAKAARAGDPVARSRYYFYDTWDIPDKYNRTMPQVFPETAPGNFTYFDDCHQIIMTTFYPFQWDLNYANPMVFNDMTDNLLYLANRGIDVFRLDAVPYIWKQLGTTCRNLPEVHKLVRMMKIACNIVCPGVLLLGEVVMEPKYVVPYFGTPENPECDILYNVTTMCTIWHTLATHDVSLLKFQVDQMKDLPGNCIFQNYIRCHDDIGWGLDYGFLSAFGIQEATHKKYLNDWFTGKWPGSMSRGELYNDSEVLRDARLCGTSASLCGIEAAMWNNDEEALNKAISADIMLHAFMFTLSGIPVLYSGDEIGMLNDYTYHDHYAKKDDSRYIHRGNFDWSLAEKRNDSGTVTCALFSQIHRLIKIRKENPVFHSGAYMYSFDTGSNSVLGVVREYKGQRLLGLFNFSDQWTRTVIENTNWTDLTYKGSKYIQGENEDTEYWLEPYGFRWLLKSEDIEHPVIDEDDPDAEEEELPA